VLASWRRRLLLLWLWFAPQLVADAPVPMLIFCFVSHSSIAPQLLHVPQFLFALVSSITKI